VAVVTVAAEQVETGSSLGGAQPPLDARSSQTHDPEFSSMQQVPTPPGSVIAPG
jgi:hypothetical protein